MVSQRINDPAINHIDVDNERTTRRNRPTGASRAGTLREPPAVDVDLFDDISATPPDSTHNRIIEDVESYDSSFCCFVCQASCPSSDAVAPPCVQVYLHEGHVCCRECWIRWAEVVRKKPNTPPGETSCPYCREQCLVSEASGVDFEAAVIFTSEEISERLNQRYEDLKRRNAIIKARILELRQSVNTRRQNIATLRAQLDDIYMTLRSHNINLSP
ncbi:hypothetical protein RhiJN_07891 [Ceratobasidium sp. AG-Ba]|nr:hypothetical protein RhiJN_07891 [Ceratobasidium sp. AG-Ba]QRW08700.1 hypothetical protein RhiLY_07699 [Ceratobasidium sp. AG-Ba]